MVQQLFKIFFLITGFCFLSDILHAQINSNSPEIFKEINDQVWIPFTKTYNNYDTEGFLKIHSPDLLRVPRDSRRISNFSEYYERMNYWFNNEISMGHTRSISFRFLERFHNSKYASEVGIYRVINNPGSDNQREFYGKFHVLLEKKDEVWKILIDSDTSDGGSIGPDNFERGFQMEDVDPFIDK